MYQEILFTPHLSIRTLSRVLRSAFLKYIQHICTAKREGQMNMNSQENRQSLLEAGFTQTQIEQLAKLRRDHAEREKQQISAEQRRLEFVRWLVTTGRLTA